MIQHHTHTYILYIYIKEKDRDTEVLREQSVVNVTIWERYFKISEIMKYIQYIFT